MWEFFQNWRIDEATRTASDAKLTARNASTDIEKQQRQLQAVERQCEKLTLAVMAMAEILRDRLNIQPHEIESRMTEIDLRDGQLDGRLRTAVSACPGCRRPNKGNRTKCLYCGAEMATSDLFFPEDGNRSG